MQPPDENDEIKNAEAPPDPEPSVNDLVIVRDLLRIRKPEGGELQPDLVNRLVVSLKGPHGQELEIPLDEIEIDARNPQRFRRARNPKRNRDYTLCGNCHQRIPRTGDPTEDHHAAMRHNVEECPKREQAERERHDLLGEYSRQMAQLDAPTRALLSSGPQIKPAPRAWWKFWA